MLSFHVKFVQTDRWKDGRQTTVKQYALDLSIPGHKNLFPLAQDMLHSL